MTSLYRMALIEAAIDRAVASGDYEDCTECCGQNPNCSNCGGSGVVGKEDEDD